MRSPAQIRASRANGARSRGPVTEEGKRRSSYNAIRHGLLAKCVVLCNESRGNFEELLQQHIDRFQPADDVEFGFIEEMAASYWRLRRAWSIETKMFNERIAKMPPGDEMACIARSLDDLAGAQTLTLLNRYETRLHSMYQRALRNLLLLRNQPRPNEPEDQREELPTVCDQPPANDEISAAVDQPPADEEKIAARADQTGASDQLPAPPELRNEPKKPLDLSGELSAGERASASPAPAVAQSPQQLFVIVETRNEPSNQSAGERPRAELAPSASQFPQQAFVVPENAR